MSDPQLNMIQNRLWCNGYDYMDYDIDYDTLMNLQKKLFIEPAEGCPH